MLIFDFIFEGLPLVLVWHKLETNAINITTQILTFIFPFVLFLQSHCELHPVASN